MRCRWWMGAVACLIGCGVGAEATDGPSYEGVDAEWTFEKARFVAPWTWAVVRGGEVEAEGVVLTEVREAEVVFGEVVSSEVEWGAIVVPITEHVDPPGASTVECIRGDEVGCRDTAGLWFERDLMVWTDALEEHEPRVALRACDEGEGGTRVVSFARGEDALVWEVERVCAGAPGEVVRVELRP